MNLKKQLANFLRLVCFCAPPHQPQEEELAGAMSEATQVLELAVTVINEALEELRYEIADMEEEEA